MRQSPAYQHVQIRTIFFGSIIRRTLLGWPHRTPRSHCHSQHPCQRSCSHYAVLADLSMVSSRNLPMSQAVWSLTIPMVASASREASRQHQHCHPHQPSWPNYHCWLPAPEQRVLVPVCVQTIFFSFKEHGCGRLE